ncbi:tRNA lysidine(34) synthetase TilS [Sphingobacterium sp. MYb382]|uniref:tRNA lysidine(34) synthetase TilS n=1 Tax=Sphingobacterium sp. MYb382 TaxID=2745278 RepID=UPI0030A1881A
MGLLADFQSFVTHTVGIQRQDKVLLAVSGGRDSMLMAHLFQDAGFDCILAHCNFQLRGEDSDLDEALVRGFADAKQIPLFVKHFDTKRYAEEEHVSIQMAARDLRYAWFEELRLEVSADWIAVAQHKNDHIETVLLNLTRGTGLLGLQGILPKRGRIVRPLLFLTSAQVTAAMEELEIAYRDDQSNFSTKYARNKIRLDIVPEFKKIAPDFEDIMARNIQHFQEAQTLLASFIDPLREQIFRDADGGLVNVRKTDLQGYIHNLPLWFELFRPYGFSKEVLSDVLSCWDGESGRIFHSSSHELLLDREMLYIRTVHQEEAAHTLSLLDGEVSWYFAGRSFHATISDDTALVRDTHIVQLDADKLVFPMQLRYWQEGDFFIPLGMTGRKKLSDFFVQQKLSLFEKRLVPLLVNGNGEIVWLVPYRLDNRYKITERTKKVFTLVVK